MLYYIEVLFIIFLECLDEEFILQRLLFEHFKMQRAIDLRKPFQDYCRLIR